jgi:hypothetical protein
MKKNNTFQDFFKKIDKIYLDIIFDHRVVSHHILIAYFF